MSTHPYVTALGDRDPALVMAETPLRLRDLLDRLTPEQIEHHPAPGKWNFREILAHFADCEIAWSWRLRFAYEKENAFMQPFEQDPWARIYAVYSAEQALATFTALRAWNLTFFSGLTEADKQRPVAHPEIAGMTLWTIARIAAGHDPASSGRAGTELADHSRNSSLSPPRLRAAYRHLGLLLVIHPQLVAALEPRHHFLDVVDVHHERPVRAPEEARVQEFQQLLERPELRLPFKRRRRDRDGSIIDRMRSRCPSGRPAAGGSASGARSSRWPAVPTAAAQSA